MKRRILTMLLAVCILAGMLAVPVAAKTRTTIEQMADSLYEAKLFLGAGTNDRGEPQYQLGQTATRVQAVTMLVRILGKEAEAKQNAASYKTPFTDVPKWAKGYVGYAYAEKLTNGISAKTFGSNADVSAQQYLTFCLRALGYSSKTDFTYAEPYAFAEQAGFRTAEELGAKKIFTRADMVLLSCDALLCKCKDSGQTLGERLGVAKETLAQLSAAMDEYTAQPQEKPLSYDSFREQVNAERREEMANVPENILEIPLSHEYDDLLSHAECEMLLKKKQPVAFVTKAQAEEDAEYLWKAFASAYGGYYYFGDETFQNARQKVLSDIRALPGSTVEYRQFENILYNAYSFIKDRHSCFYAGKQYTTWYVKGIFIREDTKGYYSLIDGEKWYLQAVDRGDLNDMVHVTIADTGELVYGLYHRFLTADDADMPRTLTLSHDGRIRTLSLKWTKSQAVGWDESNDPNRIFAAQSINGHNVVKIRGFNYFSDYNRQKYQTELEKYMKTGTTLSGQDYVIVDSRSNGGGSDGCPHVWLSRFLGESDVNMEMWGRYSFDSSSVDFFVGSRLWEHRQNHFNGGRIQQGVTEYPRERNIAVGAQTGNTHPVFFLTDYLSGSSGESVITQCRTVENVLVVGTNTLGCMFSNVELPIYLPNTGFFIGFGQHAELRNFVNREGYGYDPDIWVPSEYALELTLKLCDYYGLKDADAAPIETYGETPKRVDLSGYTR